MNLTAQLDDTSIYLALPSTINECNFMQLLFLKQNAGKVHPDVLAFVWLQTCCSEETFETLLANIDNQQLHDISVASLQSMTFDESKLGPALRTKPPLSLMYLKNITLYPQGNLLQTMCFGQFIDAEEQLFLYFANQTTQNSQPATHNSTLKTHNSTKHLAALAATIYRPYNETRYSSTRTFELAAIIESELSTEELEIILDHYLACRYYITNKFKKLFPQKKTKEPLTEGKEANPPTGGQGAPSPRDIRDMVAGYNNKMIQYATSPDQKEKIYHENAWTVLEFIEYDITKSQAEQEALKNIKH